MKNAVKAAGAPLILTSSHPPAEVCAPLADFTLLSEALGDAPLLCPPAKGKDFVSLLEHSTTCDLRQAIAAFRRHQSVSVYISLSEKVGLPLALLLRARSVRTPHVLVAHHLTSAKKKGLQKRTSWLNAFSRIVVLSEPQENYLRSEAGYPEEQTVLLPDSVDTDFWTPQGARAAHSPERMVLSVGQEHRDYATLFAAAREMNSVPFMVVAGSAWAARKQIRETLPANVTVLRDLSYGDLRTLYERASVEVVPLEAEVPFAAGANGLLEAMSMGKATLLTETPGLSGYLHDGETGRLVPAGNPKALADAIQCLHDNPSEAIRLGNKARLAAQTRHSLRRYVTALTHVIREAQSDK
ncbi:MAG: glycosyltransferase family 4 protein [Armatimonadota bacterium]